MENLVILSIYDGGYNMCFKDANKEKVYLEPEEVKKFKKRFGIAPDVITIKELASHYYSNCIIVICEDGMIDYKRGTKK